MMHKDIKKLSSRCICSNILYLFKVSGNRTMNLSQYYEKSPAAEHLLLKPCCRYKEFYEHSKNRCIKEPTTWSVSEYKVIIYVLSLKYFSPQFQYFLFSCQISELSQASVEMTSKLHAYKATLINTVASNVEQSPTQA